MKLRKLGGVVGLGLVMGLMGVLFYRPAQATQTVCVTRMPEPGGFLVEGVVGRPQTLNPLLDQNNVVDRELTNLLFDGLTQMDSRGRIVPALAENWQISGDAKTVTFTLRANLTWHDGQPVTSQDVAFTYGLLQGETFTGLPQFRSLWQSITITPIDDRQIVFGLSAPYSPFLEATTVGLLPAHILAASDVPLEQNSTFNQNPIGTGLFMMIADQDWANSGRLFLAPNPAYWQQGTILSGLEFRFFPDEATLYEAFRQGEIHAVNSISTIALPTMATLPGMRLITSPAPRYTQMLFNLNESNSSAINDIKVRQAMALSLDRRALLDRVLNGQGVLLEGPFPSTSPAYNPALMTPIPLDVVAAANLLNEAGWALPDGATIRQKTVEETTTSLELNLLVLREGLLPALAANMALQWAELGITVNLTTLDITEFYEALNNRAFDMALANVAPTVDPDLYDFWSQEAILKGQNYGGWNNRRASEAMEQARQLWTWEERKPLYDTFLGAYANELPALTIYQQVMTYGISETVFQAGTGWVDRADIGVLRQPRGRYQTLAHWFVAFTEVECSEQ
ncbi:MAG: peptide ABC transporter substrate-binding protein [Chloroflexi bacterium]|nr:peptide ABC transporter substrate-binding protein [Chloroflexota bacterium]MBP8059405.1 peptide ABC transporter substrate-binding protein [Chloroflexota bacterium]